jgi:hypothetical protein
MPSKMFLKLDSFDLNMYKSSKKKKKRKKHQTAKVCDLKINLNPFE